jgi:Ni/Fe-hydrogenase subunit HybB-like protein
MAHAVDAKPVGGPILTRFYKFLLGILAIWGIVLIYRFAMGIGAVSGLTDGYPWGVWIAFDVVTGTALGCGGYAIAILAYILNKGKYHPVVRPAVLTSALGYTLAAVAIVIDVGRPWFIWRIPLGGWPDVGKFNWDSALLEVALCVMAYMIVLWIELSPAFMEKWRESSSGMVRSLSEFGLKFMDKALVWIVAMGLLLPTMHQSSLGTVMLLAGHKLHPLWNTGWIPMLFLISVVGMGYAIVVWESAVSSAAFGRKREMDMLSSLAGVLVVVNLLFLVLRFGDIVLTGKFGMMFNQGLYSVMFWVETALFVIPTVMFFNSEARQRFSTVFTGSVMLLLAGALYRFDAYIVAYNPGPNWNYFPSLVELFITIGVVAVEVAAYIYIVKRYPILGGAPATQAAH